MGTREDFEKRLHVAYMDEATVYSLKEVIYHAVVSMIMNKGSYIDTIETGWADIRKKYGVKDGVCLHFTDIKALLNPAYYTRGTNERNPEMENIFCNNGALVTSKLHEFYSDICSFIASVDFSIQVTGQRFVKTPMLIHKKVSRLSNGYWYPLFRDHLDEMAYHLIKIAYDEHILESAKNPNAKYNNRTIKLRYDGDFDLTVRNDFRNAFSHSISNGTKNFTADAFKDMFDEVRFIDKSEIGFCITCPQGCTPRLINHAGNEIVDFLTIYASRYLGKGDMKEDYIKYKGDTPEEVDKIISKGLIIEIDGKEPIDPMKVIRTKLIQQ